MQKIWIWNWVNGGYNYCNAFSKEEALQKAKEMTSTNNLKVLEESLHEGTWTELENIEKQYAGMFN